MFNSKRSVDQEESFRKDADLAELVFKQLEALPQFIPAGHRTLYNAISNVFVTYECQSGQWSVNIVDNVPVGTKKLCFLLDKPSDFKNLEKFLKAMEKQSRGLGG